MKKHIYEASTTWTIIDLKIIRKLKIFEAPTTNWAHFKELFPISLRKSVPKSNRNLTEISVQSTIILEISDIAVEI